MNYMNCDNGKCKDVKYEKAQVMKQIYEIGFALNEAMLFLDTHPDDREAIEYYITMKNKYKDALNKYADYYGPLDCLHLESDTHWMWVATPMPWEEDPLWTESIIRKGSDEMPPNEMSGRHIFYEEG